MNRRDFLNLYLFAGLMGGSALVYVGVLAYCRPIFPSSARWSSETVRDRVSSRAGSGVTAPMVSAQMLGGFESGSPVSMRSDRSAYPATKPSEDDSAGSVVSRSQIYEVTAYSHGCTMPRSGRERPAQRGANGRWPVADVTVAADTSLHGFGSEVLIAGLGFRTVGDRGHVIKGRRLDLFADSCAEARRFGRQWLAVYVVPDETRRFAALEGTN